MCKRIKRVVTKDSEALEDKKPGNNLRKSREQECCLLSAAKTEFICNSWWGSSLHRIVTELSPLLCPSLWSAQPLLRYFQLEHSLTESSTRKCKSAQITIVATVGRLLLTIEATLREGLAEETTVGEQTCSSHHSYLLAIITHHHHQHPLFCSPSGRSGHCFRVISGSITSWISAPRRF